MLHVVHVRTQEVHHVLLQKLHGEVTGRLAVVAGELTNEDRLEASGEAVRDSVASALNWLRRVRDDAKEALGLAPHSLGIFGTSNAARWVDAELDGGAAFFVDEDLNRVGRKLEGRPIFAPHQVPAQSSTR